MRFLAGLLTLAGLGWTAIPISALAQGSGVHQHGIASLQVMVEGSVLELQFQGPLDSLVGFESAPRNETQRQAVRRMAEQLHQPQRLFVPTIEADCTPSGVLLASDVISPALLAPATDATSAAAVTQSGHRSAGKGHADLEAAISFNCGKPQALTGMQVRMFDAFSELRQIDVEIVTTKGQSGARLSPNRSGLTW